jgi:enterochelin esterase-like enzyme
MTNCKRLIFALAICLLPFSSLLAQAPARVLSPEIGADNKVTFRIRAPQATQVVMTSGGDFPQISSEGLALTKDPDGVWAATLDHLDPGAYRYVFRVDGVATMDPANPAVSQSNDSAWSLMIMPGSDFMDTIDVPHGAVAEVPYYSEVLGKFRRLHVYTPPGYEKSRRSLPVLYLLHGAYDSDDSWSSVGRAGIILDNLIAEGRAEPMIVVMPAGHTGPFTPGGVSNLPLAEFATEFREDIKPFVESRYPVSQARGDTAIAGLSMGGAQTLDIAFNDLGEYGYVGVYSSGVFDVTTSDDWEQAHLATLDNNRLKRGLDLFWFATGSDDFLLDTSKATVELFREHNFEVEFEETGGGHTWINWREYLHTFLPRLFQ